MRRWLGCDGPPPPTNFRNSIAGERLCGVSCEAGARRGKASVSAGPGQFDRSTLDYVPIYMSAPADCHYLADRSRFVERGVELSSLKQPQFSPPSPDRGSATT